MLELVSFSDAELNSTDGENRGYGMWCFIKDHPITIATVTAGVSRSRTERARTRFWPFCPLFDERALSKFSSSSRSSTYQHGFRLLKLT